MSFREIIEQLHRADPAIRGGALAGNDGLTVEEWQGDAEACDLAALCAEMALHFRESGRIALENGLGDAGALTLSASAGLVFIERVSDDYFFLVVTDPGAIPGKWRFLLRQAARRAREVL